LFLLNYLVIYEANHNIQGESGLNGQTMPRELDFKQNVVIKLCPVFFEIPLVRIEFELPLNTL